MNNKNIIWLIFVLILSSVSASLVSADSAVYVYRSSNNIDQNYIDALNDVGFSVDTVSYYDLNTINFDDYDLILVNNELFPNPDLIPINDYPSLIVNSYHMDDWGWSKTISSAGSNQPLWAQKASDNYITQGFPTQFQIYTECCYSNSLAIPVYYLSRFNKAYSIETVVATTSNINDAIIGISEPGDALRDGKTANARSCFFGIHESSVWTNWSEELFKRCAVYSAYGFDRDDDGYRENVDCDDNNANIYPGAPEICNGVDDNCDGETDEGGDSLCDDGLYCNGAETCAGVSGCQAGTPPNCDDGISCTDDSCNEDTNSCDNIPNDSYCDDGLWCNGFETCDPTLDCQSGTAPDCDDGVGCTVDSCDEVDDECDNTPDDSLCDDGLACNGVETCDEVLDCQSGTPVDCSDYDISFISTCYNDPDNIDYTWDYREGFVSECTEPLGDCTTGSEKIIHTCDIDECGALCETNNNCTNKCVDNVRYFNGNCLSDCTCDYDTQDCDTYDGWYNTTNFQWVYDEECTEKEQRQKEYRDYSCGSGDCVYVVTDTEWEDTGNKSNKTDGTSCDDGLFCTVEDTCQSGVCTGGSAYDCSFLDNQCNVGVCNEDTDSCEAQPTNEGLPCNDELYCTVNDVCTLGLCGGTTRDCSDSVGCTDDSCIEDGNNTGHCENTPNNANCDDGLFCNGMETCDEVLDCQPGTPVDCSAYNLPEIAECDNDPDNNSLTWDYAAGFTSECDDVNDECTTSTYSFTHTCDTPLCGAQCEINDDCANYCSVDGSTRYYNSPGCDSECSCNYDTENCETYNGWYYTGELQWVDNDECTEKEQREKEYRGYSCSPEACVYEVTDTQWEDTGETRNKLDGTSCDDGLFCTVEDTCQSGVCTGGSAYDCSFLDNQCNVGVCNEDTDQCEQDSTPKEAMGCDDGSFCTVNDICTSGVCNGDVRDCSDGVSCTDDYCDDDIDQCVHTPDDTYCDNGLFCDGEEYCDKLLGCQAGIPVDCSANDLPEIASCDNNPDNNPLTWDYAAGFTSECDEGLDACTTSTYSYTHTCDMLECGAECETDGDCEDTDCDGLDGCYSGTYRDYHDVANTCQADCTSTHNACTVYDEIITDLDGDGYDTECDNDCDDTDASIYPGASELMDDIDQNCVNDAPTLLSDVPDQSWPEDTIQVIDLSLYFDDVDGDSLSFVSTSPDNIDIDIVDSTVTLTPDADWHGTRYVVFTASDGDLSMSSNIVTLTVTPVNDAPTVTTIPDQEWPEDTTRTLNLDDYFSDVDGDTLTYTSTTPANIDVDISGGVVTLTPDANWHGTSNIMFTADDGNGGVVNSNVVNLVVTTVNDAPVLDHIPDIEITEGDFIKIVPGATDPDLDAVTFTFTWPLNSDGEWQTDFNDAGTYMVTISALDGKGGMDSQQVIITVNEAGNHAPVLDYIAPISVTEGDLVKIVPSATDLDYDALSFTFTWPLNSQGEWQTTYTDAGIYMPRVTVSDGFAIDWQDVLISVLESGNHAPVIDVVDIIRVYEGEKVKVTPNVYDPDQDPVTVTYLAPLDSNGEWQTKKGDKGTYYATISASDGFVVTTATVKIIVSEPPYSDIYISGIRVFNYKIKPGTNLEMSISFSDSGNINMKGVKVAAYIPELGLYRRIGPFNLEKGKGVTKDLRIYIPPYVEKGEYTLKIIISNDDIRREKHRIIHIV